MGMEFAESAKTEIAFLSGCKWPPISIVHGMIHSESVQTAAGQEISFPLWNSVIKPSK